MSVGSWKVVFGETLTTISLKSFTKEAGKRSIYFPSVSRVFFLFYRMELVTLLTRHENFYSKPILYVSAFDDARLIFLNRRRFIKKRFSILMKMKVECVRGLDFIQFHVPWW